MVQVAVPVARRDAHYERERHKLEQIVGEMNGEHGGSGTPVIHYLHQNLPFDELVALYVAADVMLVTPFRDGMNLVAKEYVMSRTDLTGRLVLSEFAGAAAELRGAFMVNPHDLEGVKEAIRMAVNAGPKESSRPHVAYATKDLAPRRVRLGGVVLTWPCNRRVGEYGLVDEVGDGVHDARGLIGVAPRRPLVARRPRARERSRGPPRCRRECRCPCGRPP